MISHGANIFAILVFLAWPIYAFVISQSKNIADAAFLLFLIPYLFLPANMTIDLPLFPAIDKLMLSALVAYALLNFINKAPSYNVKIESKVIKILISLVFIYPIFTWLTNTDVVFYGPKRLNSMGAYDAFQYLFKNFLIIYIPFILGFKYLDSDTAHKRILVLLVCFGLFYSLLMLWEIRMSPRLQSQIYGFFPSDWRQQIRQGGFRPIVFLGHGLLVAIFACMLSLASVFLLREKARVYSKLNPIALTLFFILVLVACKSLGALIFLFVFGAIGLFFSKKSIMRIYAILALIVLTYPFLRTYDLLPTEQAVDTFQAIDADRAASLDFRFFNEDTLLIKANERPLFGWGSWARNRVFDENSGEDLTVTDGGWILILGINGWVGYLAIVGLHCFPIVFLYRSSIKYPESDLTYPSFYTLGVTTILLVNLLDILPNDSFNLLTTLLAGAVMGRVQRLNNDRKIANT